jgi:hypothetical protein
LYKTDPEDEAVQLAATRAKKQYLQAHPEVAKQLPNNQIPIGPQKSLDKFSRFYYYGRPTLYTYSILFFKKTKQN